MSHSEKYVFSAPPGVPQPKSLVFFDLETTGLDPSTVEIIQIAAKCGDDVFNQHIMPTTPIPSEVTEVTGLYIMHGTLYSRPHWPLITLPARRAMRDFIQFLSDRGGKSLLIAHNAHYFDAPIITRTIKELGLLDDFLNVVWGFADTLPMFRYELPERPYRRKNYKLLSLAQDLLDFRGPLHDARRDVEVLEKLTQHPRINADVKKFMAYGKSVQDVLKKLQ